MSDNIIISIDIGIEHLAISIFINHQLIKWNVMSISNPFKIPICSKCSAESISYELSPFPIYYCLKHSKQHESKKLLPKSKSWHSLNTIFKLKQCLHEYDIDTISIISVNELNKIKELYSRNYLFYITSQSNYLETHDQANRLKNTLYNEIFVLYPTNISWILIEKQIGPQAVNMTKLEGMIIQQLSEWYSSSKTRIATCIPMNRRQYFFSTKSLSYYQRKKKAINIVQQFINNNSIYINYSYIDTILQIWNNNYIKQDDLADSFLQGIWFIETNQSFFLSMLDTNTTAMVCN